MLTYSQLAKLQAAVADRHVLNAYVDANELDAVSRRSWRRTLANGIAAARKGLVGAPHAERTAFDQAAELLADRARDLADDLDGAPGWAAFVAPDEVLYAGATYKSPKTGVVWRQGIAAAPYLRLLDADGPVYVAVVDTRSTEIYQWDGRDVTRLERVSAHAHVGRAAHMGDAPRDGFHAGTRGTALTDAAHRALDVGRERMLHDVADRLEGLARPRGWIVLAGIRTTVNDAIKHLGKAAQKRAIYMPGLSADASEAEIAHAAAEGRARLDGSRELARVVDLLDRAAARGRAAVGFQASLGALAAGAAREVLVTSAFLDARPDDAEAIARAALTHGARVSELCGDAAVRLDADAEGIAATLRFPSRSGVIRAGLESVAG